jgi:hypothetical protein
MIKKIKKIKTEHTEQSLKEEKAKLYSIAQSLLTKTNDTQLVDSTLTLGSYLEICEWRKHLKEFLSEMYNLDSNAINENINYFRESMPKAIYGKTEWIKILINAKLEYSLKLFGILTELQCVNLNAIADELGIAVNNISEEWLNGY